MVLDSCCSLIDRAPQEASLGGVELENEHADMACLTERTRETRYLRPTVLSHKVCLRFARTVASAEGNAFIGNFGCTWLTIALLSSLVLRFLTWTAGNCLTPLFRMGYKTKQKVLRLRLEVVPVVHVCNMAAKTLQPVIVWGHWGAPNPWSVVFKEAEDDHGRAYPCAGRSLLS